MFNVKNYFSVILFIYCYFLKIYLKSLTSRDPDPDFCKTPRKICLETEAMLINGKFVSELLP